ncbi:hypothetical protein [Acinetobacter baumannii]|uniref:hypothetical protein n=1 Tax=Acinetobacter baumannii TaxID=470 RepID=UPI003891F89B
MNIIYKNQSGSVSVFTPTQEALDNLTLEEIAQRIVPNSVPYWIVDPSAIPSDRTFRDAWELDEASLGEPSGIGGEK